MVDGHSVDVADCPVAGRDGLQRWLLSGRCYITVTGKGFRPRSVELGGHVAPRSWRDTLSSSDRARAASVLLAACLSTYTWSGHYTLDNSGNPGSDDVWDTLKTSVLFSVSSTSIAVVLGLEVLGHERTRLPGRRFWRPCASAGFGAWHRVRRRGDAAWLDAGRGLRHGMIILFAFIGRFTSYAVADRGEPGATSSRARGKRARRRIRPVGHLSVSPSR